ncbi:hypothetical protein LSH36_1842g00013 [Paralvinella palmiformis]|uniref:Uncharacterized protein n=1 Tax=Paralvinella palmiformis TaxID=53620 RepID=A0AAD9IRT6_9ANNE|nr:hypothetical protein LSH36_1842g00013 [Paralvinella palmiformis]
MPEGLVKKFFKGVLPKPIQVSCRPIGKMLQDAGAKAIDIFKRDPDNVSDVPVHTRMNASHAGNQMVRKFNMPKVDLQPFSGDMLTFRRFTMQFNTSIATNCVSPENA